MLRLVAIGCFLLWTLDGSIARAQTPSGWKQHDMNRPLPPIVTPGASQSPVPPPSDAIVLFDGSSLDAWRTGEGGPAKWIIRDGAMESVPGGGYVYTVKEFGDIQLHVEWASPAKVEGKSQGRGNSGVFLQRFFEVQVLDSFDNVTYADGQAAAIYGQYPPLVNASRKPGEWQTYDIVFRAPKFREDNMLEEPARITVLHNGVLVQDNVSPWGGTSWMQFHPYGKRPDKQPLALQDHGNPVRYRNIWVRELPPVPLAPPDVPYDPTVVSLSQDQRDRLVGKYSQRNGGTWEILEKDGKLYLVVNGPHMELIPHSPEEFGLRYTAGVVQVAYDERGKPTELRFSMGGSNMQASRFKEN